MDASLFIAGRLRLRGRIAMVCIAVSYLVMIMAMSVSSGFRYEIRSGLSGLSGDILISTTDLNVSGEDTPIESDAAYLPYLREMEQICGIKPVVYRAGIVRHEDSMHGVVVKGLPDFDAPDSVSLAVSIPRSLADASGLKTGDRMLTYFVGGKMKLRQFNIVDIHDALVETDNRHVVYASLSDMQRLNGWADNQVSAIEMSLYPEYADEDGISAANEEAGTMINAYRAEDEEYVIATSSVSRYPQLFGWLSLIDYNVFFILLLMTIVAGFNMISGLLIMLFENTSVIGLLKSLGMTDRSIAKVFLASSSVIVGKGMAVGNILAVLLCVLQGTTHFLKLDPENYYVSFVPVHLDPGMMLLADAVSFAVIMLLLTIPCIFISKVDPAETVRVR